MLMCSSTHQRKSLLVWCRKLHALVSVSKEGSQVASYHRTAPLTIPGKSSWEPAKRQRLTGSNSSSGVSKDRHTRERSAQSKALKNEGMQKHNQRRGNDFKVSSELRKLCLDDFPADREKQVCEEAHQRGVQVSRVSKKDLDRMSSGGVHQGVCLEASPLGYLTEDWAVSRGPSTPLWLVLERIQDPMNLGAILRSAYFLGVDRVISSLQHSCPLSPVVSKASSGAMEVMGVYGCENLEEMLKLKLLQGWDVVGTVGHQAAGVKHPCHSVFRLSNNQTHTAFDGRRGGWTVGGAALAVPNLSLHPCWPRFAPRH
ncbi:rRNA methyltransferase 1, mitochondrial [Oryzias melastigma]|uniref:rRNA methyltransferase 1, mitochondrial n=1 Tax=Oryzias melastigma TaxID=30732 RepID=A0A834C7P1_ORYME|nr:rRNA methyltransferase 1, mitochondrial [Oryzias melastigma]